MAGKIHLAGLKALLSTGAGLAALWWLLSAGRVDSWLIGIPTVAAAAWAAYRLRPAVPTTIAFGALLRFAPLFLRESLRGGIDVARRTLSPQMRIRPGFMVFHSELRQPAARVFFASCISLLPGTLAADLDGDRIEVHLLDSRIDAATELRRLEQAIARIFPPQTAAGSRG